MAEATASPSRIDIAVCTRNRLPLLRDTLAALGEAMREIPAARILVVNNGSTDGTAAWLAEAASRDPRIVPLSEKRPGLYNARSAAIRHFEGEILVFVDDDVLPAPDFLRHLSAAFSDPAIGAVGASIEGLFNKPLPSWFSARFLSHIPVLPFDGAPATCAYPCYPPGACLAIRRAPCLDHFLTPARRAAELGSGGRGLVDGDDTDLCEIYARAGFRIIRIAEAKVRHRVHSNRLTPEWIIGKFERDGRLRVRLARLRGKPGLCRETLPMLAAFPALFLAIRLAERLSPRRAVLARAYHAKSLGAWREMVKGGRGLRFSYPPDPAR